MRISASSRTRNIHTSRAIRAPSAIMYDGALSIEKADSVRRETGYPFRAVDLQQPRSVSDVRHRAARFYRRDVRGTHCPYRQADRGCIRLVQRQGSNAARAQEHIVQRHWAFMRWKWNNDGDAV